MREKGRVEVMQLNELVKKVMKVEKVSQLEMGEMVGRNQASISQALNRPSISGEYAVEMLEKMGYELVAVKMERQCVGLQDGKVINSVGAE